MTNSQAYSNQSVCLNPTRHLTHPTSCNFWPSRTRMLIYLLFHSSHSRSFIYTSPQTDIFTKQARSKHRTLFLKYIELFAVGEKYLQFWNQCTKMYERQKFGINLFVNFQNWSRSRAPSTLDETQMLSLALFFLLLNAVLLTVQNINKHSPQRTGVQHEICN